MIHVHELTKHYCDLRRGQFVALGGISFHARPGQIYGLLGPNGAGKTTALRILSTVLRPTGGTAAVNGFDVLTQSAQVRRQIGFMSANTAVYDRMTGWEMVEYFGRLHGIPQARLAERMEFLFDRLKMNDTRDILGAKMSTGMKQKVSVARAVVHDPPVLIFDEATAGLDVLVARALLNTVLELRDQGKCIVFSTHIMREAEKLCDRIAIMHRGHILAEGTLEEMRDRHHQRDLEELFFQLISQHDEAACRSPWPISHEAIERQIDFCPRSPRSIARPPDAVHDRGAADAALSAVGGEPVASRPVHAGAGDARAGGGGREPGRFAARCSRAGNSRRQWFAESRHAQVARTVRCAGRNAHAGPASRVRLASEARAEAAALVQKGDYEAALYFPPDFAARLDAFREATGRRAKDRAAGNGATGRRLPSTCPAPKSSTARPTTSRSSPSPRLSEVLRRWTERIGDETSRPAASRPRRRRPVSVVDGRRGRRQSPQRRDVVEDPARAAAALGLDRRRSIRPSTCAPAKKSAARWKRC